MYRLGWVCSEFAGVCQQLYNQQQVENKLNSIHYEYSSGPLALWLAGTNWWLPMKTQLYNQFTAGGGFVINVTWLNSLMEEDETLDTNLWSFLS